MKWYVLNDDIDRLGLIPCFLSEDDPRPAREQLNEHYAHGGGWRPLRGFRMDDDGLYFPEDPPFEMIAEAHLRDEIIRVYNYALVAIIQPDGSFEISRMD